MKIKNIILLLSVFFLLACSFFGLLVASTIVHELSHKSDYKGYVYDDEIYLLAYPKSFYYLISANAGLYIYHTNSSFQEEVGKISERTEYKAYFLSSIITLFWLVCFLVVEYNLINNYLYVKLDS